jgi:Skp family chaperone for outer membrane proteins
MDTLALAKRLEDGGFTRQQAETLSGSIREAVGAVAATKQDLDAVEAKLDAKIDKLDAKIDMTAASTKHDLQALEAKLDAKIDKLDGKIDKVAAEVRGEIERSKNQLLLAMIGMTGVFATIVTLLRLLSPGP